MKLKDRVAIVTGAGRNIGEEVAALFAAEGAKVAVVDLDQPRGEHTAAAIKAAGGLHALARLVGIRAPALFSWRRVPADRILQVEAVTGVPRETLRPELYRRL